MTLFLKQVKVTDSIESHLFMFRVRSVSGSYWLIVDIGTGIVAVANINNNMSTFNVKVTFHICA